MAKTDPLQRPGPSRYSRRIGQMDGKKPLEGPSVTEYVSTTLDDVGVQRLSVGANQTFRGVPSALGGLDRRRHFERRTILHQTRLGGKIGAPDKATEPNALRPSKLIRKAPGPAWRFR